MVKFADAFVYKEEIHYKHFKGSFQKKAILTSERIV